MEKIVLSAALLILISLASASKLMVGFLFYHYAHDKTSKSMARYPGWCGYGWVVFENSCYAITTRKNSWEESGYSCRSQDVTSYLVNIGSQKEDEFVIKMARNKGETVWIGLNDMRNEGRFVWDNTQQEPTYTHWASTEPNDYQGGEDCVMLYYAFGSLWYDDRCDVSHYAICEKSLY